MTKGDLNLRQKHLSAHPLKPRTTHITLLQEAFPDLPVLNSKKVRIERPSKELPLIPFIL